MCLDLSVRRKIEKHREKVLRCDSVLQRNPFVQAVPSSKKKDKKKKVKKTQMDFEQKDDAKVSMQFVLMELVISGFFFWVLFGTEICVMGFVLC